LAALDVAHRKKVRKRELQCGELQMSEIHPATIPIDRLAIIAAQVNAVHEQAHAAARTAIEHAVECGRLLREARDGIGHGGWLPWIKKNLKFGPRQAQKYLRLADYAAEMQNANCNSHLSIDSALKLLAKPEVVTDGEQDASVARESSPSVLFPDWIRTPRHVPPSGYMLIGRLGEVEAWIIPYVRPGCFFVTVIGPKARSGFFINGLRKAVRADAVAFVLDHLEFDADQATWQLEECVRAFAWNMWLYDTIQEWINSFGLPDLPDLVSLARYEWPILEVGQPGGAS
jgi:hypothetical protein